MKTRYPIPSAERQAYVARLRSTLNTPLSTAEKVAFACAKAAVAAEDDRKRQPALQLQLPEAA